MFEQLVHSNLGTAYRAQGRLEEAWSFYEQAIALGREIGTPHHVGVSLAKLGGICHELGRFDTAIEYFEQALLVARKVGSKEFTGVHHIEMAACLYDKGAFERSRDCLLEALPLMRDRRPIQEGVALGMLAVLQVKAGEKEAALHSVGQAETILRAAGGRQNLARFLAQSACVHAIAGSPDEARESLYEALSLEEELGRLDTVLQRRLDEARSLVG